MKILNNKNIWQASNLPEGLNFKNGVFSGIPTAKGTFTVPVTVSNSLGSDTKNITILVKNRIEKFSILQNGAEIEQVSIAELQAMVQNGTAQEKYNCTNTQILLPINVPALAIYNADDGITLQDFDKHLTPYISCPPSVEYVPVNFCSFRNVTLQDGTVKPGLILQFDKTLWSFACFFNSDFTSEKIYNWEDDEYEGDWAIIPSFSRWRYSLLRNWLNSSGVNWFSKSYNLQKSPAELLQGLKRYYIDILWSEKGYRQNPFPTNFFVPFTFLIDGVHGFLDLLPPELTQILQPVKITTQAFFDEDKTDDSIKDPEEIDGVDVDITYDKIFLPSLEEVGMLSSSENNSSLPTFGVEGDVWEFWSNLFKKDFSLSDIQNFTRKKMLYSSQDFEEYEWKYAGDPDRTKKEPKEFLWNCILNSIHCTNITGDTEYPFQNKILLRSANFDTRSRYRTETYYSYNDYTPFRDGRQYPRYNNWFLQFIFCANKNDNTQFYYENKRRISDTTRYLSNQGYSQPTPTFVIC